MTDKPIRYKGHWVYSAWEGSLDSALEEARRIAGLLGKEVEFSYATATKVKIPLQAAESVDALRTRFSAAGEKKLNENKIPVRGGLSYRLELIDTPDATDDELQQAVDHACTEAILVARRINNTVGISCIGYNTLETPNALCSPSNLLPGEKMAPAPR